MAWVYFHYSVILSSVSSVGASVAIVESGSHAVLAETRLYSPSKRGKGQKARYLNACHDGSTKVISTK